MDLQRTPYRIALQSKGILNQHQTNSSNGKYNPAMRSQLEASFLGISIKEYKKIPLKQRAKYGYISPWPQSKVLSVRGLSEYGSDTYLFKPRKIGPATTLVAGDSLEIFLTWARHRDVELRQQRFIPWSFRDLMLPFLRKFERHKKSLEITQTDAEEVVENGSELMPNSWVGKETDSYYIEAQIWKPLMISDVDTFIFKAEPPSGEFLAALQARGIPIYHRQNGDIMSQILGTPESDTLWWDPK